MDEEKIRQRGMQWKIEAERVRHRIEERMKGRQTLSERDRRSRKTVLISM